MPRVRTDRGTPKSTPSLGVQNDLRVQVSGAYTIRTQLVVWWALTFNPLKGESIWGIRIGGLLQR